MIAIALDDEPPALKILQTFCQRLEGIELRHVFSRPNEALRFLEQNAGIELLFLDIQMPAISGLEFYRALPREIPAIFTTAHSQYAVEGFNLNAVDYLLKPFSFERFAQAVYKAQDAHRLSMQTAPLESHLFVRASPKLVKVYLSDILYIESFDDYVKIYTLSMKMILGRHTLQSLQDKLPADRFLRVHRSFLVAKSAVSALGSKSLWLGETEIPIGASHREAVRAAFDEGE